MRILTSDKMNKENLSSEAIDMMDEKLVEPLQSGNIPTSQKRKIKWSTKDKFRQLRQKMLMTCEPQKPQVFLLKASSTLSVETKNCSIDEEEDGFENEGVGEVRLSEEGVEDAMSPSVRERHYPCHVFEKGEEPLVTHQLSKDDMWVANKPCRGKNDGGGVSGLRQRSKDDMSLLQERRGHLQQGHKNRSLQDMARPLHVALRKLHSLPSALHELQRRVAEAVSSQPPPKHVDSERLYDLLEVLSWTFAFNIDSLTRLSELLASESSKICAEYLKSKMKSNFSVKIGDYEAENLMQWALLHKWASHHKIRTTLAQRPFSLLLPHDMKKKKWCYNIDSLAIARMQQQALAEGIEQGQDVHEASKHYILHRVTKAEREQFQRLVKKHRQQRTILVNLPRVRAPFFHSNLQNLVTDSARVCPLTPPPALF